jgi:putative SOS response-associated peptidase YedK
MPVILRHADEPAYLEEILQNPTALLERLLQPYPAHRMRVYRASRTVNDPRHDTVDCIQPLPEATAC